MHDEKLSIFKPEDKELVVEILHSSMRETNEKLKLNVEITISIDFGSNYSECH
jgi:DNA polymerase I-like protein with 3'-5' exonuclease and polymerase domains